MRVEDAPPAGWYPDPDGGSRLRWWEGTDWSDRWRAPPTAGVLEIQKAAAEQAREEFDDVGGYVGMGGLSRRDSEEIISQVRQAARSEAERAAQLFGDQAMRVTNQITPLVTEYTNKFLKWVRIVAVIGVILGIAWVAWQIFAQVSLFDWIGDRIDNLTDNIGDDESGAAIFSIFW
jgi:hypothetical protein